MTKKIKILVSLSSILLMAACSDLQMPERWAGPSTETSNITISSTGTDNDTEGTETPPVEETDHSTVKGTDAGTGGGECAHGVWQCVSDPVGKRQCGEDGTWGEVIPCDICVGEGECLEGGCEPGKWVCDGAVLKRCDESGDSFVEEKEEKCISSALCDAENGECDLCLPGGDARCTEDGRDKEVCASDGQGWVVKPCPDSICVEGQCRTRLCEPHEWSCSGSALRRCNSVGDGFVEEDRRDCESSLLCDAEHGECDVCVPGKDVRCTSDDKDKESCSADGQGWIFEDCPDDICVSGECRSSICHPNEWSCSLETLRHCSPWGDAWLSGDERVCDSSELCDEAAAECDVCLAGSAICNAAGTARLECSADGQKQTTVECPFGVCIGEGGCVECEPGAKRCDSFEYLSTCDASGSWPAGTSRRRCYDDGLVCKSGACVSVDCGDPPSGDVYSCSAGGTTFGSQATCSCESGYAGADTTKTCSPTGTWIGSDPSCTQLCDWDYRREITLTGPKAGLQILVRVPEEVYSNPNFDKAELRFSTDRNCSSFDLDHWVESWSDGTVWVKLINRVSTIYMFYGNPAATDTGISRSAMFPDERTISTGIMLSQDVEYDYVTINASSVTLQQTKQVKIKAQKIVINSGGKVSGDGAGHNTWSPDHAGRGGDGIDPTGGGGGGYGGAGGNGGKDSSELRAGIGGEKHGDTFIESIKMGSAGGNAADYPNTGGYAGGALTLEAQVIVVNGILSMRGGAGRIDTSTVFGGDGGGGGSGGGILLVGNDVTIGSSAELLASGGAGGSPPSDQFVYNAGGGGGGGRIKLFGDSRLSVSSSARLDVSHGVGGTCKVGNCGAGRDGEGGTTLLNGKTNYPEKASVHSEEAL